MKEEQKKRVKEVTKPIAEVLMIGIVYLLVIKITGWMIPCPIRLVTGKYCPGCGISRMILAILRLDFEAAFYANRLLFFLLPVILLYAFIKAVYYIKTGINKQSLPEQIAIILSLIVTIAFWVMRNMESFSFLAPMG